MSRFSIMDMSFETLLSLLVAFQLFFVAVYLFTNSKGNRRNNFLLGVVFLMFSISVLDFVLRSSGVILPLALLHMLDDGFFLLYGPVLFLYVQGVIFRDFKFELKHILHFIPYLIYAGLIIYQLVVVDRETQSQVTMVVDRAELPLEFYLISVFMYAHLLTYLFLSWRSYTKYQAIIKDQYSAIDQINLDWLSFMMKTFAAIAVVSLVHNLMPVFGNAFSRYATLILLLILTFIFINRVLMKALNQPLIFSGIASDEVKKYAGSSLNRTKLHEHKEALELLMQKERLFLDPNLTSGQLADRLGISNKDLSQVINQGLDKKFFDFVNAYRCEEVMQLLQGPDKKITVLEAMYQSGFNSKSSFNKEFKKLTGRTPSEFKKSLE